MEFNRQLDLETDSKELFRWHSRPGAFERLGPPWDEVTLDGPAARLIPGDRQVAVVSVGPLKLRWESEITSVEDDREFRDVQLAGPFASWTHTHSMHSRGVGRSRLEDRIEYRLPFGAIGRLLGGRFARKQLDRLFAYRHRITEQDLARHKLTADADPLLVLVTGASGLVGSALCAFLTTGGHRVRRLVRSAPQSEDEFLWDPAKGEIDGKAFEGVDAVIHLAGESIAARRWTDEQKQRILDSRVNGTRLIVDAMAAAEEKPKSFICASAIGIYGDRGDELLDEESERGSGFLADVVEAWETRADALEGVRTVRTRFGVILSPAGGALAKMLLPFQMGAGGRIGNGRQWMSWVALDDVVGAIHHALITDELEGAVNVVSPSPATNSEYTRVLGRVLKRPTVFPMPAFAARLAFGEMADELLLGSQRVLPKRLLETGYVFSKPDLEGALRHQLGRAPLASPNGLAAISAATS